MRINGAEPLIHHDFLDAFRLSGQYGPLTNGLVFKDNFEYLDEIKKMGMRELYISYHFDFHDKVSLVSKDYLEFLFKEIKLRGLNFIIMCTLTRENYNRIEEYCDKAYKMGASEIKFTNFLKQGNANAMDNNLVLRECDLKDFFKLLYQVRQKYNRDQFEIKRCGSFGLERYRGKNNFKCVAGIDNVCITPDKKVYPCVFLAKPGNEIGFYQKGEIYIESKFYNSGKECMALKALNNI
ncbi:MAG: hypothetical protein ACI4T1_00435 [Christensenellales bacterium]